MLDLKELHSPLGIPEVELSQLLSR